MNIAGGWFARPVDKPNGEKSDFLQEFLAEVHAGNIKEYLRKFTRLPHLAGTEQNLRLAEQIQEEWLKFGLDSAELVWYDVLLSYPNTTRPNFISVVDQHGDEVQSAQYSTKSLSFMMGFCDRTERILL
ncbi:N-acetylated-alpha-linked acidic dipeptidase 2 [Tachysurus ichikawai]